MTYKEHYLTLSSPEEIMQAANTDLAWARLLNPDRIEVIHQSAEEAINEKFEGVNNESNT